MRVPLAAVVPSRYERPRLEELLGTIRRDVELAIVVDTGHDPPLEERAGLVVLRGDPDGSIYGWWNAGVREARARFGLVDVAILNDDVRILAGSLRLLADALRAGRDLGVTYPDRARRIEAGIARRRPVRVSRDPIDSREMTGFCFVVRGDLPVDFDEGYRWWYGDTQFEEVVRLLGFGVARVEGIPIEHESDAERDGWSRRPELRDAVEADRRRFETLHQRVERGAWRPIADGYRRLR